MIKTARTLKPGDRVIIKGRTWSYSGKTKSVFDPSGRALFLTFGWDGEIWGKAYSPDHEFDTIPKK